MSYEKYKELEKNYAKNNASLIESVKKSETPQNILMAKTVYKVFEDDDKITVGEMEFGFSEKWSIS
jgi:hypothetical protein